MHSVCQVLPEDGGWTLSSGLGWPCRLQPNRVGLTFSTRSRILWMDLQSSSLVGPFPSSWCRRVSKVYTALSICYKAYGRVHETFRSGHGPFLYARLVPPSEARHRGIGVVCSLYALWGSRYRCLPECRNPRKRLGGKDNFLGEGLDPKETRWAAK